MTKAASSRRSTNTARGLCALMLTACVASSGCMSAVPKGALIGAGAGAALGIGTGALISDDKLLGTSTSLHKGDVALAPGSTMLAGAVVGAVFGAVVGAMIGKGYAKAEDAADASHAQSTDTAPRAF
jgi:hypothetical protein